MTLEELKILVKQGESGTLEFKKSTTQLKSAGQTLCAFLNCNGGELIIGINDKGQLIGQHVTDNTKQELAATIKKFEPSPTVDIQYFDIENNKQIILLKAFENDLLKPYFYDGKAYERIESTNSAMPLAKVQHLLLEREKQQNRWETWPASKIAVSDLDHNEIIKTITEGIRLGRINPKEMTNNVNEILLKLGLLDKESDILNNAAVVLFGTKFLPHYPQCLIRLARFRGTTKTEFLDNKQVNCHAFCVSSP